MQALSQLSYGPVTLRAGVKTDRPRALPVLEHALAKHARWIMFSAGRGRLAGGNPDHRSGPISSLLVAADVADDVGDVLVAFLFVGDEGGIVIVIVFDGLVDLDVVL